jgi:hypothetical protein
LHEEAVDQHLPAIASDGTQMVFTAPPENVEDNLTLVNQRHRVGITPKPLARLTAINGSNFHPTESILREMTPLVQIKTSERDTLPSGQGIQQTSMKGIVAQRRDDQMVSQQEGPQSKLSSSNTIFAIAIWPFEAYQIYMCYLAFFFPSLLPTLTVFIHTCRRKRTSQSAYP